MMDEKEKEFRRYYSIRIHFLDNLENKNPFMRGRIEELKRIKAFVFDDFESKERKKK